MKVKVSPNIAFIKYWGKKTSNTAADRNIGLNPSLSMTLSNAHTQTTVLFNEQLDSDEILLNGNASSKEFNTKVTQHLDRIFAYYQKSRVPCSVESVNNFPTGTGIASSASGFAALTLALIGELLGKDQLQIMLNTKEGLATLSMLSRLGSGSAARSVSGPYMYWDGPSAESLEDIDWKLHDTIVIFSKEHKAVPSSEGHLRAASSPLMQARLKKIPERINKTLSALRNKDIHSFGKIIETEAQEMHSIMESSSPAVIYKTANTVKFLKELESQSNRDFYWTLDAGSNPHIISERPILNDLISLLKKADLEAELWEDSAGYGPVIG